jgi:hypothetical protein
VASHCVTYFGNAALARPGDDESQIVFLLLPAELQYLGEQLVEQVAGGQAAMSQNCLEEAAFGELFSLIGHSLRNAISVDYQEVAGGE